MITETRMQTFFELLGQYSVILLIKVNLQSPDAGQLHNLAMDQGSYEADVVIGQHCIMLRCLSGFQFITLLQWD